MATNRRCILLWLCALSVVDAQELRPILVYEDGIVNGASFLQNEVAPGSVVSIFGEGFASGMASASGFPLPMSLEGVSVQFGDRLAPLFFVSESQINVQAPRDALEASATLVRVHRADGQSASQDLRIVSRSPAVFLLEGEACGQGAALNVHPSGAMSVNSPSRGARPGQFVSVFATGLGVAVDQPADGFPAPSDPPAVLSLQPGAALGPVSEQHVLAEVSFVGKAPGLAAVDQLNLRIPEDAPTGCSIPLTLQYPSVASQAISVHIAADGGACSPLPSRGFGSVEVVELSERDGSGGQVGASVQFASSEFAQRPEPLEPSPGCVCGNVYPDGPACGRFSPKPLSAGEVSVSGPSLSSTLAPGSDSRYAPLSSEGALAAGEYRFEASGGPDIAAFALTATVPEPLSFTNLPTAGDTIPSGEPFVVRWTGGDPRSVLVLDVASRVAGEVQRCRCVSGGEAGEATLGTLAGIGLPLPRGEIDVTVTQLPSSGIASTVEVEGLGLGVVAKWKRSVHVGGLTFR